MEHLFPKYYPTLLFILKSTAKNPKEIELGDLDENEIYSILVTMDKLQLVRLAKGFVVITDNGKSAFQVSLLTLEKDFMQFVNQRLDEVQKEVNVTSFMESKFIKPNPLSEKTTNDNDFGVYFIRYLNGKSLIKYDEETLDHVNYWCIDGGDNPKIKMWFHNLNKPLYVALKNQSDLVDFPRENLLIRRPDKTQIAFQINTNKESTWLVRMFKKIIDNTILTIVTIIGTVIGTLLAIMIVNYFNHKGFRL